MGKRGTVYNKLFTPELWEQVNKDNKALLEDFLIEKKSQRDLLHYMELPGQELNL